MAALRDMARSVEQDGFIVISFANSQYLPVLENWLVAIERLNISNLIVVALDRKAHRFLKKKNVRTVFLPNVRDTATLWKRRVGIFREVIGAGIHVIHSDIDAVWLRDPIAEFFCDRKFDVIASQGTIWPEDVHKQWGFVLCCGLVCFRATAPSRALLEAVQRDMAASDDDQISLNRVIAADAVQWEVEAPYHLPYNGHPVLCSRQSIVGRGNTFAISVLPHHLFQRLTPQTADPSVVHPLAPKEVRSKWEVLASVGGWFVNPLEGPSSLSHGRTFQTERGSMK